MTQNNPVHNPVMTHQEVEKLLSDYLAVYIRERSLTLHLFDCQDRTDRLQPDISMYCKLSPYAQQLRDQVLKTGNVSDPDARRVIASVVDGFIVAVDNMVLQQAYFEADEVSPVSAEDELVSCLTEAFGDTLVGGRVAISASLYSVLYGVNAEVSNVSIGTSGPGIIATRERRSLIGDDAIPPAYYVAAGSQNTPWITAKVIGDQVLLTAGNLLNHSVACVRFAE